MSRTVILLLFLAFLLYYVTCSPSITTSPESFTKPVGSSVMLVCQVQDHTTEVVTWQHVGGKLISQGNKLKTDDTDHYSVEIPQGEDNIFTYILHIIKLRTTDQGGYTCAVTGTDASVTHQLTINEAPAVPTPPPVHSYNFTDCCLKKAVSASCMPVCDPFTNLPQNFDPLISCVFDLQKLLECGSDGKNHAPCCKRRGLPDLCLDFCTGQMPSTLEDTHLECLNKSLDIIMCYEEGIDIIPGPPTGVTATAVPNPVGFAVTWSPPLQNAEKVEGYHIHYKISSETVYQTSLPIGKNKSVYHLSGLMPNKIYTLFVSAFSVHGSSQPSEMIRLPTIGGTPPVDPNVNIKECCSKPEVHMSQYCQDHLCKSDVFTNLDPTVIVKCYGSLDDALKCVSGHRNHTGCCMRGGVPDLCLPLCAGDVQSLGDDIAVCFTKLPMIEACIMEGIVSLPSPPRDLKVNPVGQTTATLQWLAPNTGTVTQYLIAYLEHNREGISPPNMVTTSKTSIKLTNLTSNTEYDVTMVSVNDAGQSLPSPTIGFLTYAVSPTGSPVTPSPGPGLPYNLTECCMDEGVSDKCLQLCDYDFIIGGTPDLFTLALQCINDFGTVIKCGSDGRDHTPCCKERSVDPDCYKVCQGNVDDIEIKCALAAPNIAQCFKEGLDDFPRPPSDVSIDRITFHTITLSWLAPTVGPSAGYYYVLCEGCDQKSRKAMTTKTTYILQNLQPGYRYNISVVSVNKEGSSIPSPVIIRYLPTDEHDYDCSNNFTKNANMLIDKDSVYKLVPKTVSTLEDCKSECINATHGDTCTGYMFSTKSPQCTLAIGRYGLNLPMNGTDFYARGCNFDLLDIPPMNGSAHISWNNQKECCNHHNVSDVCLPFCENGNAFTDPDKCKDDFPVTISCAADNKNHTSCCQQSGVPDTCLPYCWGAIMDKDHPITHLCLSYTRIFITCFTQGKRTIPSVPQRFRVVNSGTTFIETAWEKPDQNCDMGSCLYDIQYYYTSLGLSTLYNLTDTTKNLTNLKPLTQYYLTVSAVNMYGSSLSSPIIQARTLPVVTFEVNFYIRPESVIDSGKSVTLICEVFGAPNAEVSMKFKTKKITANKIYTIASASKVDDGEYTCTVKENPSDPSPVVKKLVLLVRYKPKILNIIGDKVAKDEGKVAYLKCIFEGLPLSVVWTKGGQPITHHTSGEVVFHADGTLTETLKIYNVRDDMYGQYECTGTNVFGSAVGKVDLKSDYVPPTVIPPTLQPRPEGQNFSTCCINNRVSGVCMDLCSYDVDFSIIIIDDKYEDCIQHLPVYVTCGTDKKDHSKCCDSKGVIDDCMTYCKGVPPDMSDTEALLKCLPDATRIVECIELGQVTIPYPPINVKAVQIQDNISVSWDPPSFGVAPITIYDIKYHTDRDPKDLMVTVAKTKRHTDIPKILPGSKGRTYYVSVTAGNNIGQSLPAKAKPITITDKLPAAPKGLVATVDGTTLHLKWTPPSYTANIAVYVVKYKISAENSIPKELEVKGGTSNMVTLTRLALNTMYEIFVVGRSAGKHEGANSNTIRVKTGSTISITDRNKQKEGSTKGGVIAAVVIIVLILVGAAVAGVLYYRRKHRHRFSEAVTFENPQYGSHDSQIKISGLPSDHSEDNPFGYSPLHEEREENQYSSPMLSVDQVEFKPRK